MSKTVSIVIPAFNAAKLIDGAVNSALNQTHTDIEVIVVDDGSSDNTLEVLGKITDPRLRVLSQANRGQSAALNRGATDSRGEFLKFMDADDWMNRDHIAAQMSLVEGHADAVASCRWGYFVDQPQNPFVRPEHTHKDYPNPIDWIVDSLTIDEGMMGGWMWLIPKAIWERVGGWDEQLSLNNDFDFSIRLLLASSEVRFAADAVYSYREGAHGALSTTKGRAAMESAFRTTESGCAHLLTRERSARTRKVCSDRWQEWLFQFYPEFPDLADAAAKHVSELGGSDVRIEGGRILRVLLPIVGWRAVRQLQVRAYRMGWKRILRRKIEQRLDDIRDLTDAG